MNWEWTKESIVFLGTVLLCTVLLPLSLPLFRKFGLVDRPNARSSHTSDVPRGTGLIVVLCFVVAVISYSATFAWYPLGRQSGLEAVLWAVLLLVALGFIDDKRAVPSWLKLVVQCGAAAVLIAAGFVMPLPDVLGLGAVQHHVAEQVWTLLWIVGVVNAVNFVDGSDGLATSLSVLCMLTFVGISRIVPAPLAGTHPAPEIARAINLLGLAGIGSALPFLLFNLAPARCFLGDAGSTFFGLLLALLGILTARFYTVGVPGAEGGVVHATGFLAVPWLVLFVPIADGVRVALDRLWRGRSPFKPDNRHLHHLLHRAGLSANQIVFIVGLTVMVFGFTAAIVVRSSHSPYLITGILVLVVYGLFWFVRSSYPARRFVTLTLNRRLLHFVEVTEGYENAISFKERFEQELARVRRHGSTLSAVVVNASGLKVSSRIANPLENPKFLDNILCAMRREDIKSRFSTDRLAFVLVETDRELGGRVCRRIRSLFHAIRNGESAELQVGIGFASYPEDGDTVTKLLKAAEERAAGDMRTPLAQRQPLSAPATPAMPAEGTPDSVPAVDATSNEGTKPSFVLSRAVRDRRG